LMGLGHTLERRRDGPTGSAPVCGTVDDEGPAGAPPRRVQARRPRSGRPRPPPPGGRPLKADARSGGGPPTAESADRRVAGLLGGGNARGVGRERRKKRDGMPSSNQPQRSRGRAERGGAGGDHQQGNARAKQCEQWSPMYCKIHAGFLQGVYSECVALICNGYYRLLYFYYFHLL
jgi:hypothetical protein